MNRQEHEVYKTGTFTYEEARDILVGLMKDRARYAGFMYKTMGKEKFASMAEVAFSNYGAARKSTVKGECGKPRSKADWIIASNGPASACEWNEILLDEEDKCVVRFNGKCALVAGWEEMGLSREEVKFMCDMICYGDYALADALDLKASFNYTNADGIHDGCEIVIEKKEV